MREGRCTCPADWRARQRSRTESGSHVSVQPMAERLAVISVRSYARPRHRSSADRPSIVLVVVLHRCCLLGGGAWCWAERKVAARLQQRFGPTWPGPPACCSRSPTSSSCCSRRSCGRRRADKLLFYTRAGHLRRGRVRGVLRRAVRRRPTTFFGLLDAADPARCRRRERRPCWSSSPSPRWASTASCSRAGARTASTRCSAGCARRRR